MMNKNISKSLKNKSTVELFHQLFTVKIYDNTNSICISKINFLLYKAYSIEKFKFNLHTKQNYRFFDSLHNDINFRLCPLVKIIRVNIFLKIN